MEAFVRICAMWGTASSLSDITPYLSGPFSDPGREAIRFENCHCARHLLLENLEGTCRVTVASTQVSCQPHRFRTIEREKLIGRIIRSAGHVLITFEGQRVLRRECERSWTLTVAPTKEQQPYL